MAIEDPCPGSNRPPLKITREHIAPPGRCPDKFGGNVAYKGLCAVCHIEYKINGDGGIYKHRHYARSKNA